MGDGLVKRMKRSLLSLLINGRNDWKDHLQLLLFCYRTARHSSTGLPPYEVLLPSLHLPTLQESFILDPSAYNSCLHQNSEIVEANIVEATDQQRAYGIRSSEGKWLSTRQHVLLSNPSCGKLDLQWTRPWTVTELKGPTNVTVKWEHQNELYTLTGYDPYWNPHRNLSSHPKIAASLSLSFRRTLNHL